MKVNQLIRILKNYNPNAKVTINCPNTEETREIWYLEKDIDPQYENDFVDIVMEI